MRSASPSPRTIRWLVILIVAAVSGVLANLLIGRLHASPLFFQSAALLLMALAVYAWLLDSLTWSVVLSGVVLVGLLWTWAAQRLPAAGWQTAAFMALAAFAARERLRRSRHRLRLRRALEELHESQTEREQAAGAARRSQEAAERKLARYEQLQSVAELLSAMGEPAQIAKFTVECAYTLIGKSDACSLYMLEPDRQELSLIASRKREAGISLRAKHGDQFERHVLRTHKPLIVNDVRRDFRFSVPVSSDRPVAAVIAAPLLVGDRPEGVLRLDSPQAGAYAQDDLRLLDILMDLVAAAMTNARLLIQVQQLAVTDSLTGLLLRRPLQEQLTRELLRGARAHEPVALLMLDVDHFKRYNDTYGHVAGDAVLRSVAGLLRRAVPAGGLIARYGGEEFAVVLPKRGRHDAADVAERLRALVERETDTTPGSRQREKERPRVTVSIGVAVFPEDAPSELELIRAADQRLYQAKNAGRNRVCSA